VAVDIRRIVLDVIEAGGQAANPEEKP